MALHFHFNEIFAFNFRYSNFLWIEMFATACMRNAHTNLDNFWTTEKFRELMVFWSGLHTSTSSSRESFFSASWCLFLMVNCVTKISGVCVKKKNKRAIQNKRCRPRLTNFHTWKARVIHWVQVTSMSGETVVASIYMVN